MNKTFASKCVAIAAMCMLLHSAPALAESPVSWEGLEQIFGQIAEKSKWDMSREMLWG